MSINKKGLCQSCGGSPSLEIREKTVHIKWKCGFICGEEIQQYYNQIEDLQSNNSIDREDIKEIQNKLLEAKIIFSTILLMKQIYWQIAKTNRNNSKRLSTSIYKK